MASIRGNTGTSESEDLDLEADDDELDQGPMYFFVATGGRHETQAKQLKKGVYACKDSKHQRVKARGYLTIGTSPLL